MIYKIFATNTIYNFTYDEAPEFLGIIDNFQTILRNQRTKFIASAYNNKLN